MTRIWQPKQQPGDTRQAYWRQKTLLVLLHGKEVNGFTGWDGWQSRHGSMLRLSTAQLRQGHKRHQAKNQAIKIFVV